MTVVVLARAVPGAVVLLLALGARRVWTTEPAPAAVQSIIGNTSTSWTELLEGTGTSVQTHWLLPTRKFPTSLPQLPEYYGATVHPAIPPVSDTDSYDNHLMAILHASVALRNNMAAVFGYFMYLPENGLDEELYSALSVLHRLVRLRRLSMGELVAVVPAMAHAPPRTQFLILFRRISRVSPRFARGAADVWLEALEAGKVDVDNVMRPHDGPLVVDFLSGFDHTAIERLSSYHVESSETTSSVQDTLIFRVLNALRDQRFRLSQPLFGLILSLRSRNTILPDKEESEIHLVNTLLQSKLDGWDKETWEISNDNLESPHKLIKYILSTLLFRRVQEPHVHAQIQEVFEYIEVPKPTFTNAFFDQLSTTLNKPSLDIPKLLENIVIGEYPDEIIDLRWRVESYIRNGLVDVGFLLRGFNRFDYETPDDVLVAILTRIQKKFNNLPHEILSTVNHLKHFINFKNSRAKWRPILNSDITDMLHVFESYLVPDEVVASSLKLRAQLQIESIDWSKILQYVNADKCGQPRQCISTLLKEALNTKLLEGRKSEKLVEDFLEYLDEVGKPVYLLQISFRNRGKTLQTVYKINERENDCEGTGCFLNFPHGSNTGREQVKQGRNRIRTKRDRKSSSAKKNSKALNRKGKISRRDKVRSLRKKRRAQFSKHARSKIRSKIKKRGSDKKDPQLLDPAFSSELIALGTINPKVMHSTSHNAIPITPSWEQSPTSESASISSPQKSQMMNEPPQPIFTRIPRKSKRTSSEYLKDTLFATVNTTPNVYSSQFTSDNENKTTVDVTMGRRRRDVEINVPQETTTEVYTTENIIEGNNGIDINAGEGFGKPGDFALITAGNPKPLTSISIQKENTSPPTILKSNITSQNNENSAHESDTNGSNVLDGRRTTSDLSPGYKVVTNEWSRKRHRKHRHYKHGIRPVGFVPEPDDPSTDPHGLGFDEDPELQDIYYRPMPTLYGYKPVKYRLLKFKRYRLQRKKRTRHHRIDISGANNTIKDSDLRREMEHHEDNSAVEDGQENGHESHDFHGPSGESCGEESGDYEDCVEGHKSSGEDYSDDYNFGDYRNGDMALNDFRSQDYFDDGSDGGSIDSRRNLNKDIVFRKPSSPVGVQQSSPNARRLYQVVNREWLKKNQKRHRRNRYGIRPVGYAFVDYPNGAMYRRGYETFGAPIQPGRLPLFYGRKPIAYRTVKYKRKKKKLSKRLRRRRKKIQFRTGFEERSEGNVEDNDDDQKERNNTVDYGIERKNTARRDFSSEEHDYYHDVADDDSFGEYDECDHNVCDESSEDYPECADNENEDEYYYYYQDEPSFAHAEKSIPMDSSEPDYESNEEYEDYSDHGNIHAAYSNSEKKYQEDVFDDAENYDANDYKDHYVSRRLLPQIRSRSLDKHSDIFKDWKRRLQKGWNPPTFTLNCPKQEKGDVVCEDANASVKVTYLGTTEHPWNGKWTYSPDPLQVTVFASRASPNKLLAAARKLKLPNKSQRINGGLVWMNLSEAASAEVLLEALAIDYTRDTESRKGMKETIPPKVTASGTAVPQRPISVGLPSTSDLTLLEVRKIHRALAASASVNLPVPDEAAELELANIARLDTLLPFTIPGTYADVKMRPLRIFLSLPDVNALLSNSSSGQRFQPASGARKGPLLREVLGRAVQSLLVKRDPMLRTAVADFLKIWDARRRRRPLPTVDPTSLADALPAADARAANASALAAARAFLTWPDARAAAAVAALGNATADLDVTKGQLLRRLLECVGTDERRDQELAKNLRKVVPLVLQDGLGAQAPRRTLATVGGLSVDVRALFRDSLNASAVLTDARATSALKELLRAGTSRSFDAFGIFGNFDASPYRTRAQLLGAVLRHLARAAPAPRTRSAARALVAFVMEKNLLVPMQVAEQPSRLTGPVRPHRKKHSRKSSGRKRTTEQR